MSYCVNCGVELRESERKCPLCDTTVVNPNHSFNEDAKPAYPIALYAERMNENRKLTFVLASVLFLLPVGICFVCDLVLNNDLSWSWYVFGGVGMLWIMLFPPIILKRNKASISLFCDTVGMLALLYLVERRSLIESTETKEWFFPLAMPIVLTVAVLAMITIFAIQLNKGSYLYVVALLLVLMPVLAISLEIITTLYQSMSVKLSWSLIIAFICLLLSLIALVVARKRDLKNSIKKHFHV